MLKAEYIPTWITNERGEYDQLCIYETNSSNPLLFVEGSHEKKIKAFNNFQEGASPGTYKISLKRSDQVSKTGTKVDAVKFRESYFKVEGSGGDSPIPNQPIQAGISQAQLDLHLQIAQLKHERELDKLKDTSQDNQLAMLNLLQSFMSPQTKAEPITGHQEPKEETVDGGLAVLAKYDEDANATMAAIIKLARDKPEQYKQYSQMLKNME